MEKNPFFYDISNVVDGSIYLFNQTKYNKVNVLKYLVNNVLELVNVLEQGIILTLLFCFASIYSVKAQLDVPVDLVSGKPIVNIPIYEFKIGNLSLPVSIYYKGGGIKVGEDEGDSRIGIGWELMAGGSINRVVRSLPDDEKQRGWIFSYGAGQIRDFSALSGFNCSSDIANTITGWVSGQLDTEPDVFNFNFGGYSGKFIFDNDKIIQTIPFQDLKIEPQYDDYGSINKIVITSNEGISYSFLPTKTVTESIQPVIPEGRTSEDIIYQKILPELYPNNKSRTYTIQWSLSAISSPYGASIHLSYGNLTNPGIYEKGESISTAVSVILRNGAYTVGGGEAKYKKYTLYNHGLSTVTKILREISAGNLTQTVVLSTNVQTEYALISPTMAAARPAIMGFDLYKGNNVLDKSIQFERTAGSSAAVRRYLLAVREVSGSQKKPPYKFEYYGVSGVNDLMPPIFPQSKEQDYWGYYNGNKATELVPNLFIYPAAPAAEKYRLQKANNYSGSYIELFGGNNRDVNSLTVTASSLTKITFPTGGNLKIDYEPNTYYDAFADSTYNGAGIRVKKITINDGVDSAHDIVKDYVYTGGKIINRPQFSFPLNVLKTPDKVTVYTNADNSINYDYYTARTEVDLNPYTYDHPNVMYEFVEEKQAGKGKVVSQFSMPTSYGQENAAEYVAPNNWEATLTTMAMAPPSSSICGPLGNIISGKYTYPYPPNTNYEFERGLLKNVKYYNQAGGLLKENTYEYIPVYKDVVPKLTYGITLDFFTGSANRFYLFGKYKLITGISKLKCKEKEIIYDPTLLSRKSVTENSFFYSSPYHRLLSSQKTSTSDDGSHITYYITKFKYPQDYVTAAVSGDSLSNAIKKLQDNLINNKPVETVFLIQKPNEAEKVIGATLNKFKVFPNSRVFPNKILKLNTNIPLTNFTPSGINNGTFVYDNRYKLKLENLDYNEFGDPLSTRNSANSIHSTLYTFYGYLPVASVSNAYADQVLYSNFDVEQSVNFPAQQQSTEFEKGLATEGIFTYEYVDGRFGKGKRVNTTFIFKKTGLKKGMGSNYIFSCWVKAPFPGAINITLTDASGHSSVKSINYDRNPDKWVLYEGQVVTSMMNSVFDVKAQCTSPVSLDDMLFYPEPAQVTLFAYDKENKIAETNPKGNTTFFEYDALSRLVLIRDKNQNILERYAYNYKDKVRLQAYFSTSPAKDAVANTVVTFENLYIGDVVGVTRNWDFGDGSTMTTTASQVQHTYVRPGNYMVILTISQPDYGSSTYQSEIMVVYATPTVDIHINGYFYYDLCQRGGSTGSLSDTYPLGVNIFTAVVGSNPCELGYTYKWEKAKKTSGIYQWTLLPQTTSQIMLDVRDIYGQVYSYDSYKVRCTVTSKCTYTNPVTSESTLINYLGNVNCIN